MADKKKGFTVIHNFLKELESKEVKYKSNGHMKGAEGKNMIKQYKALKKYSLSALKKLVKGKKPSIFSLIPMDVIDAHMDSLKKGPQSLKYGGKIKKQYGGSVRKAIYE